MEKWFGKCSKNISKISEAHVKFTTTTTIIINNNTYKWRTEWQITLLEQALLISIY